MVDDVFDHDWNKDLKPCPFCGGEARIYHIPSIIEQRDTLYDVVCTKCDAKFEDLPSPSYCVNVWNERIYEKE